MIVIPIVFAVVGALFAGIAIGIRRSNARFAATAQRATGTVTAVDSRAAGSRTNRGLIWVPTVRFQTADGRTIEEEMGSGTNVRQHEPGQPIEVLYDPANPSDVRTPGGAETVIPVVFTVIGCAFIVLGLAILVAVLAV